MKITFKDVGQGDSILLEWETEGAKKLGIIDCNRKDKTNPIAEYIGLANYDEIEFIILSHPHSDHYSGMIELFDVIESKNITVKRFAHSLFILGKDFYRYLKWSEVDTAVLSDLKDLVKRVDTLRNANVILKVDFVFENWSLNLTEDIILKCLSPSQLEAEKYMDIVKLDPERNRKAASRGANYLSTIFKLVIRDKYYLFTSDSEVYTFERLVRENTHLNLQKKRLVIGQLPHHGSSRNHYPAFWDYLTKSDELHAVVSAGINLKYNHPHLDVLKSFHSNGYRIHATNIVNGMEEYVEFLKQLAKTSNSLDTFSELLSGYSGGEKSFFLT